MKPGGVTAGLARQDAHDIDRILELNRWEYGATDILATRPDFVWRYNQNPAGQAVVPVIRNSGDEIVGFIWLVPLRIRVKGQDYLGATGTNLVIHPDYRHTFGYTKLIRRFEQVFREEDIPLHFSFVSAEIHRQLRRHSPHTVSAVPSLVKPLNFEALVQTIFTRRWQSFIGKQGRWLASAFFSRKPSLASDNGIAVRPVENFDDGFDQFWDRAQDKYPAMVIRDRAFLAWRFAPVSGRHYHILTARSKDQLVGYTILKCTTINEIKTGLIMDLLVADSALGRKAGAHLMAQAEAFFRTQQMSLAVGLMTSSAMEYQILRQCGYREIPAAIAPRVFRFVFFVHQTDQESLQSLTTQDWFISMADYESH